MMCYCLNVHFQGQKDNKTEHDVSAAQSCAEHTLFMWLTCYLENRCLCFLSTAICPWIALSKVRSWLKAIKFCYERAAFFNGIWEVPGWNICQDVDYPHPDYSAFCSVFLGRFHRSELN